MEKLRERLGIESITNRPRRVRLRWFDQVERKPETHWTRLDYGISIIIECCELRSKKRFKTWEECVKTDLKQMNLKRENILIREKWKNNISGENFQL